MTSVGPRGELVYAYAKTERLVQFSVCVAVAEAPSWKANSFPIDRPGPERHGGVH